MNVLTVSSTANAAASCCTPSGPRWYRRARSRADASAAGRSMRRSSEITENDFEKFGIANASAAALTMTNRIQNRGLRVMLIPFLAMDARPGLRLERE